MKNKRAYYNIITNVIVQVVLAVSGLIIPRLILLYYGSQSNGLVSSISQFIMYAALIELGIGNASIIALYRPLAADDKSEISEIVLSSRRLYLISGFIYSAIVLAIAFFYPALYKDSLSYWYVWDLVLCIGGVNAIDYFVLGKYKVLLIADQKYYVLNIVRTLATILLVWGSVLLLRSGYSILATKVLALLLHGLEAMAVAVYSRIKYSDIKFRGVGKRKIDQRWNALVHQICATIVYNTDLVVLTLCLPMHSLLEISVYSVYAMILAVVSNLTGSMTTGINATFGDMFARGEKSKAEEVFHYYEFFFYIILFFLYGCMAVLILPFVSCYTKGTADVDYIRIGVGILFALNGLTSQIKEISGVVINGAGHYKQTQRYAIEEALINIGVSLALVFKFGIIGVLVGTLISHLWMAIRFIVYMGNNILTETIKTTVSRLVRNTLIFGVLASLEIKKCMFVDNWFQWVMCAIIVALINISIIILINIFMERDKYKYLKERLRRIGKRT